MYCQHVNLLLCINFKTSDLFPSQIRHRFEIYLKVGQIISKTSGSSCYSALQSVKDEIRSKLRLELLFQSSFKVAQAHFQKALQAVPTLGIEWTEF